MTTCAPKISVLIPTYRYGRFLKEAIESVLTQEFREFEVIISDDCSNDESECVIREFAGRDPRIRFELQSRNLGMVQNWNWCLSRARGKYVKFLFGDDRLNSPTTLDRMLDMLERDPRAIVASTARAILDEESRQTDVWDEMGAAGYHPGRETISRCFRNDRNLVGEPSAVLFWRAAATRGFDERFSQLADQEMWFHLLKSGGLVYSPDPLCAFRRHPAQQTAANHAARVAPAEMTRLTARYFEDAAVADGIAQGSFRMRRHMARHVYYSRKDNPRTPLFLAAEAELLGRIGKGWYLLCWLVHRGVRPFSNLFRVIRRIRGAAAARGSAAPPAHILHRPAGRRSDSLRRHAW
jgi:glycosyltransferase involved in cell wall biosynthesis